MIQSSGIVRLCVNSQDEMRRIDPLGIDRGAEAAFVFNAADQYFLARSFDGADAVCIVYHSHPKGGLHFSDRDFAGAIWNEKPIYPEVDHLVVDCRDGEIRGAGLFRTDGKCFWLLAEWESEVAKTQAKSRVRGLSHNRRQVDI